MTNHKVAIVTGSGKRRIGWHVSQALAERGYAIVVHYNRSSAEAAETVRELENRGCKALAVQADLADEEAASRLIDQALTKFGRIDVLVNCAAVWHRKKFEATSAADVRAHFEANTLGTFLCSQKAGLAMARQPEGGCIVLFGDWAIVRPYTNFAASFVSKGAVPTMTRTLAVELGTRNPNVRVNCIMPGPVLLPPDLPDHERRQAIAATLVKREGNPGNICLAVLFFVDNDFVTGACLPVDGGRSVFATDSVSQE
jgi:pteridine reductase